MIVAVVVDVTVLLVVAVVAVAVVVAVIAVAVVVVVGGRRETPDVVIDTTDSSDYPGLLATRRLLAISYDDYGAHHTLGQGKLPPSSLSLLSLLSYLSTMCIHVNLSSFPRVSCHQLVTRLPHPLPPPCPATPVVLRRTVRRRESSFCLTYTFPAHSPPILLLLLHFLLLPSSRAFCAMTSGNCEIIRRT